MLRQSMQLQSILWSGHTSETLETILESGQTQGQCMGCGGQPYHNTRMRNIVRGSESPQRKLLALSNLPMAAYRRNDVSTLGRNACLSIALPDMLIHCSA